MSGIKVGLFHDLNAILDDDTLVGSRHPLSTQVIGFLLVAFLRLGVHRLDASRIERLVVDGQRLEVGRHADSLEIGAEGRAVVCDRNDGIALSVSKAETLFARKLSLRE